MKLGEKIREKRKSKNMTLDQLSALTGAHTGFLSHIERGSRMPSIEMLEKIASALDTPVDYFLKQEQIRESFYKALGENLSVYPTNEYERMTINEPELKYGIDRHEEKKEVIGITPVPVFDIIHAGDPIRSEKNIIGYEFLSGSLIKGENYFGLKVKGDSMDKSRINDGDVVIVRKQSEVENGEIAVVLVDGENATVKKFYRADTIVSLIPDSNNNEHQPRFITKETVTVLGKVVRVIINM